MKTIKLLTLKLENFKGIKKFLLDTQGKNASVLGDNGTGKTTLADSFAWLLFGKDSQNKKDFNIKPLDKDGNEIHKLITEVEGAFLLNGIPLTLKKQYTEKWTKKRGAELEEFTGHEVSCWVDEVPCTITEYNKQIANIVGEDIFKLITSPTYFNTQLSWQDRRKSLLEICGTITDESVIQAKDNLLPLQALLQGRTVDDFDKILKERIKLATQSKKEIPARIDEVVRGICDTDFTEVETQLAKDLKILVEVENGISFGSASLERHYKRLATIADIENNMEVLKKQIAVDANADRTALFAKQTAIMNSKFAIDTMIRNYQHEIATQNSEIEVMTESINDLRTQYGTITATLFIEPDPDSFVCPTCLQDLPQGIIIEDTEKRRAEFASDKSNKLKKIIATAEQIKVELKQKQLDSTDWNAILLAKQSELQGYLNTLTDIALELEKPAKTEEYLINDEYIALDFSRRTLLTEVTALTNVNTDDLKAQKLVLITQIDNGKATLAKQDNNLKISIRKSELLAEEKKHGVDIAEWEGQRYLIEQFIKAKVGMLEASINSRFRFVTFKLFDTQINGAVVECCETLVYGVPYNSANSAGRTNAGIDIINTLCGYYEVSAPIFTDNAESINILEHSLSQMIELKVSQDKKMKVEVK